MENTQESLSYSNNEIEDVDFELVADSLQSTNYEIDQYFSQRLADNSEASD